MTLSNLKLNASALTVALAAGQPGAAAVGIDTQALRDAVTLGAVRAHQQAFQDIADANDGIRASGTPGYDASADYVADQLDAAGYDVTIQPFQFAFFELQSDPILERISPDPKAYVFEAPAGFFEMEYSGSDDVTAIAEGVDLQLPPGASPNSSTSGCETSDFDTFTAGSIAIIQRGSCTFAQKALNAEAAGAVGVVIFNEGQTGRTDAFLGTLGGPGLTIPVVGAAFAVGVELAAGDVTARVAVDATSEIRDTVNVLAETASGRGDRVVVVGAHLDSVSEGPGVQDNGSGSAAILEIARQMAELEIQPRNKVRFAWWGAEESGLLGAQFYVDNLSKRDRKNIALNLNFDMIGSPNYVPFVYDGDGDPTGIKGPTGSATVEQVFLDYFAGLEPPVPVVPTEFDGRSDYGPFIAVGIPAGGLFTGAEGIKTDEEAATYGGTAGIQYDPCYHLACDTFDNISLEALDLMSDAAAHAVLTFAMTKSAVPGTDKSNDKANKALAEALPFRGSKLQR